jgi:ribonuclease Z
VITSRWVTSFAPSPLVVVGPPGIQEVVDGIVAMLRNDICYRLDHHADLNWEPPVEVHAVSEGIAFKTDEVTITAGQTDHRPVAPSIGFRVEHGEHSVVVAGDTVPCDTLDALCAGTDAVVHTVLRKDLLTAAPIQRLRDVVDYHSSVEEAAQTAARAGASTLVLTHYVPALAAGDEAEWRRRAADHFAGRVELGDDLHTVLIGDDVA